MLAVCSGPLVMSALGSLIHTPAHTCTYMYPYIYECTHTERHTCKDKSTPFLQRALYSGFPQFGFGFWFVVLGFKCRAFRMPGESSPQRGTLTLLALILCLVWWTYLGLEGLVWPSCTEEWSRQGFMNFNTNNHCIGIQLRDLLHASLRTSNFWNFLTLWGDFSNKSGQLIFVK